MRLLAFAYACEPHRGSEPGAGWWWSQMLMRLGDTWVITRESSRSVIDRELEGMGRPEGIHFVYVDVPARARAWEEQQKRERLVYVIWQFAALREARRLMRKHRFDVTWHLTLANAWIGSTAALLRLPFVYGPVGGGVGTPWRLVRTLGLKGTAYDISRAMARTAGRHLNPLARIAWCRARLILVNNEDTRKWLPRRHRAKAIVFSHVVLERMPPASQRASDRVLLFAGRLIGWKGASLAILALERLPGWRLIICGDGPDRDRLQRLAAQRRLDDRVDFRGWVSRKELQTVMEKEASVFTLPSLHDDSPWAVVEAMAAGLPVVCVDRGGPPNLVAGANVAATAGTRLTADRIAQCVIEAATANADAPRSRAEDFLLEQRLARLEKLLT
jgi:glycosyltransferase involved in cell wall biosynthesis